MNFHEGQQTKIPNNQADERVLNALLQQLQAKDAQLSEKDEIIKQLLMNINQNTNGSK